MYFPRSCLWAQLNFFKNKISSKAICSFCKRGSPKQGLYMLLRIAWFKVQRALKRWRSQCGNTCKSHPLRKSLVSDVMCDDTVTCFTRWSSPHQKLTPSFSQVFASNSTLLLPCYSCICLLFLWLLTFLNYLLIYFSLLSHDSWNYPFLNEVG